VQLHWVATIKKQWETCGIIYKHLQPNRYRLSGIVPFTDPILFATNGCALFIGPVTVKYNGYALLVGSVTI
jgi:hypothetical protein